MSISVIATALELASFAPVIARWFGGDKVEEIATKVIDIAQRVTGAAHPGEAIQRLQRNADMATEFQKAITQVEADIELGIMKDRQHARFRNVALVNTGRSDAQIDIKIIAVAVGLVFCLALLGCFSGKLPGVAIGVTAVVTGIFASCLKDAYAFEFGSSRCSREKDNAIVALIKRNHL